jgi:hypothetical protein
MHVRSNNFGANIAATGFFPLDLAIIVKYKTHMVEKTKILIFAPRCRLYFKSLLFFSLLVMLDAVLPNSLEAASLEPRTAPGPFEIQIQIEGKPVVGALVYLGGRFAATANEGKVVFDGVPAGEHKLIIKHYDYEHYEQRVRLPLVSVRL